MKFRLAPDPSSGTLGTLLALGQFEDLKSVRDTIYGGTSVSLDSVVRMASGDANKALESGEFVRAPQGSTPSIFLELGVRCALFRVLSGPNVAVHGTHLSPGQLCVTGLQDLAGLEADGQVERIPVRDTSGVPADAVIVLDHCKPERLPDPPRRVRYKRGSSTIALAGRYDFRIGDEALLAAPLAASLVEAGDCEYV